MKRRTAKAKVIPASERLYLTAAAARVCAMKDELKFLREHAGRLCNTLSHVDGRIRMVELAIAAEVAGTGAALKRSHQPKNP